MSESGGGVGGWSKGVVCLEGGRKLSFSRGSGEGYRWFGWRVKGHVF